MKKFTKSRPQVSLSVMQIWPRRIFKLFNIITCLNVKNGEDLLGRISNFTHKYFRPDKKKKRTNYFYITMRHLFKFSQIFYQTKFDVFLVAFLIF